MGPLTAGTAATGGMFRPPVPLVERWPLQCTKLGEPHVQNVLSFAVCVCVCVHVEGVGGPPRAVAVSHSVLYDWGVYCAGVVAAALLLAGWFACQGVGV